MNALNLIVAVFAILALARTRAQRARIDSLSDELKAALSRLAALERLAEHDRATRTTPGPAPTMLTPTAMESAPTADAEAAEDLATLLAQPDAGGSGLVEGAPLAPAPRNPIIEWLFQGNPLAKVGIVLLFFGLAYLVRFASEHSLLPIELRLAGAAAIAIGLLGIGWRLREKSPTYALTLQGGAIGGLYLTSFAAFRLYGLLPAGLVFALLAVICAASVALAVLQRAQSLAMLASLGGYLAPILLSTGGGNHVALFSYYTLLSGGILGVSIWQAWRPVNLIGFAFTFGVGTLWGIDRYEPTLYVICQFFLALNLVIYGVLAVLLAIRHGDAREAALVDGTLTFGTPLIGFGLQVGLTNHWRYGPAFSALAFGALYLPLAKLVLDRWPARARRIVTSFLALGGGFVTLAIPLALSARWTSMAWALEGLGVLWVGRAQRQARVSWSGTGLLGLAFLSAGFALVEGVDTATFLLLSATLSLCWLAGAWLWRRDDVGTSLPGSSIPTHGLFAGGVLAWLVMVAGGSDRLVQGTGHAALFALLWMSFSAVVWRAAGTLLAWRELAACAFLLWPVAFVVLPLQTVADGSPFGGGVWSGSWIGALATAWFLLRSARGSVGLSLASLHATFWWLVFALAHLETARRLARPAWGADEWPAAGALVVSGLMVLLVVALSKRGHWAVTEYRRAYWIGALAPPLLVSSYFLLVANLLDGRVPGILYIPLMNVLEEPAAFALFMVVVWYRAVRPLIPREAAGIFRAAIVALILWWMNGVLLRAIARMAPVPWSFAEMWASTFVQTFMALAWTLGALVSMWLAARRSKRVAWLAGAIALAVVIVKLFLVDSARGGGLARAVAFIGVALLILLIGYVAPLPPGRSNDTEAGS